MLSGRSPKIQKATQMPRTDGCRQPDGRGSSGPGSDQIRIRHQSQNRQGARPDHTAEDPRPRRRGDRIAAAFRVNGRSRGICRGSDPKLSFELSSATTHRDPRAAALSNELAPLSYVRLVRSRHEAAAMRALPVSLATARSSASAMAACENELGAALEQRFKGDRSGASIAAAIIENSTAARAYVCAGAKSERSIDDRTAFEIGSITKTMTAALLAEIIGRGEIAFVQNAVETRTRIAARVFEFRINGAVLRPCQAQRQRLRDIAARASALTPRHGRHLHRQVPALRPCGPRPLLQRPAHRAMGRSCRRSPALAACAQPCPTWCVISKVSSACAIARSRQSWRELRSSFPVLTVKQQAWPGRLGLPRTGADSSCIRAGPAASLPSQRGSREALSWLSCAAACVHAQSSVRCRASTIPCGFGTSGADFLPVQNGPETVGLDGGDAVSAVGLRLGGIVTFCCSLSRTAAVQGSPLIVSLPRFCSPC